MVGGGALCGCVLIVCDMCVWVLRCVICLLIVWDVLMMIVFHVWVWVVCYVVCVLIVCDVWVWVVRCDVRLWVVLVLCWKVLDEHPSPEFLIPFAPLEGAPHSAFGIAYVLLSIQGVYKKK